MTAAWHSPSAPLTRPFGGSGQLIVRTCSFCSKRISQNGGGMFPLRPGATVKAYACHLCKPGLQKQHDEWKQKQALRRKASPNCGTSQAKPHKDKPATPTVVWPGLSTDARRLSSLSSEFESSP